MHEKILVGHKLRRFRKTIGLSQTAMADALEISPSYLNLLEHNQRPLTVGLLLRLGNSFDIDLKDFAEDDAASLSTGMSEIFADPLLADEQIPRREIQDMITAAPGAARGLITLFQAYRKVRDELEATGGDGGGTQINGRKPCAGEKGFGILLPRNTEETCRLKPCAPTMSAVYSARERSSVL